MIHFKRTRPLAAAEDWPVFTLFFFLEPPNARATNPNRNGMPSKTSKPPRIPPNSGRELPDTSGKTPPGLYWLFTEASLIETVNWRLTPSRNAEGER